jgi:hypothetical protein
LPSCLWHCVLAILPIAWLIIAFPFLLYDLNQKKRESLKMSGVYITKASFGVVFMVAPIASIIVHTQQEDYDSNYMPAFLVTNGLLILSAVLFLAAHELTRRFGAITSGTLSVFWAINCAVFWIFFTTVYLNTCFFRGDCVEGAGRCLKILID